jgi:tetratricopeptide (TPR) repeat protein
MEKPEGWEVWPPTISVIDPGFINAFATHRTEKGVEIPEVNVTVDLIEKIAVFDDDTLAFVIGHELGHLHFKHVHQRVEFQKNFGGLSTLRVACGREQEFESDMFGMQLAFKAGYSRKGLIAGLQGWRNQVSPYCRFEGLALSHPSWEERAVYLLRGDQQEALWRSLSSFQTGVTFLENHQYQLAQLCFRNVTTEFPECYEAWANLGYALLMQYCDALDEEDLQYLDVGHIVVGGFFQRPDSLEPAIRGSDEKLWFEAVGAFREALRLRDRLELKDELLMVKANLAVAYLVHPNGKDVGQAEQWFEQVFASLKDPDKAKTLDPMIYASILINSGSARGFAKSLVDSTLAVIAQARTVRRNKSAVDSMEAALRFHQARALAATGNKENELSALSMYEKYLDGMTSTSSWWPIAYREYSRLAKASGVEPKPQENFRQPGNSDWRTVAGVSLQDGTVVSLSDKIVDVLKKLGTPDVEVPVIEKSNLKIYKYKRLGVSFLATREVLSIILDSGESPKIQIRRTGLGGKEAFVSVGMSQTDLEALLGGEWDADMAPIYSKKENHQIYRKLGLAVRFKNGIVSELVVSVAPLPEA